jgi:predicted hydrocarbon binding protein
MTINWPEKFARKGHEIFLSGLPIALHCHHYNMNLQKTLESSLGSDGTKLLYEAAEESSYAGLTSFLRHHHKINTVKSKLELASTSYQYCGLGIINFTQIAPEGGRIVSTHSHHVTGWLAKFGRRETPGCFFARGWIAGALAVIFDKHPGYYRVDERECKMMQARECVFEVTRA